MAAPQFYFMPIATLVQDEDGRWTLDVDWADSQIHYDDEEGKSRPSDDDVAVAASEVLDAWLKDRPMKFILKDRL